MLPLSVMEHAADEFLDYQGMGAGIIEISHRSPEFIAILTRCIKLVRELLDLPPNYQVLFVPGGPRLLFSAIPLNLAGRKAGRKMAYVDSGLFANQAIAEAKKFGEVFIWGSSREEQYRRVPALDTTLLGSDLCFAHITSNNTVYGTSFASLPDTGSVPLVVDATSDFMSRPLDYSKVALAYGGFQKNLGPSGLALVVVREDLLGYAPADIPLMLHLKYFADNQSIGNTINTFAIYMLDLMLNWIKEQGGVRAMGELNAQKSAMVYDVIDSSKLYTAVAEPHSRSHVNIAFRLKDSDLDASFEKEALAAGLYALAGHRSVGGFRASMYNGMPLEGAKALCKFMKEFDVRHSR